MVEAALDKCVSPAFNEELRVIEISDVKLRETILQIFGMISPMDVVPRSMVRVGRDNDGGYVMLDAGLDNIIAYS